MTTAFSALLVAIGAVALLLAFGAYLWINRSPTRTERFDEYGRVPLFGVDMTFAEWTAAAARQQDSTAIDESDEDNDTLSEVGPSETENVEGTRPAEAAAPQTDAQLEGLKRGGWEARPGWPVSAVTPPPATPRFVPSLPSEPPRGPRSTPFGPPLMPRGGNGNGARAEPWQGSVVEGDRIRFTRPAEGTLQFLPGRLEISSGLDTGREIRFVRVPGPNGTEVTFGRNEGPLYRHIQLRDQTVSREHARMTLVDGSWQLQNLSRTNPVAHNGRVLDEGEQQPLQDGDKLEMGEVVFCFRSR